MQIEINYPPDFKARYGYGLPTAKFIEDILKFKIKDQLEFLSVIKKYSSFYSSIPCEATEDDESPRWNQPWFPPLDGMSMYAMIALKKPTRYLEIGSGNSTKFAVKAIHDHKIETEVISIDPNPRVEIDNICNKVIRNPVENITEIEDIFSTFSPNDIVFFDGSHRCLQNSDVTAFFIDILPAIPAGVTVGLHDIFWPNDYPDRWTARFYNEQYILGAYMLAFGNNFPLILSCAFIGTRYQAEVIKCLPPDLLKDMKKYWKGIGGGAIWFEKPEIPM